MPPKVQPVMCIRADGIVIYNAIVTFSPKSEICTIKLGQSPVPDMLRHSSWDPETLPWIDATEFGNQKVRGRGRRA